MDISRLAIVDIETTGGGSRLDRVIEVGVVLVTDGKIKKTWSTLLNPQRWIPPTITELTGIQASDLETAPLFSQIADELLELLEGRVFVAHNVRFDYGFLRQEFERIGKTWRSPHLCSVRVSRRLYPHHQGHSLDRLIERFAIPMNARHRALDDALAVQTFFSLSKEHLGADTFHEACLALLSQPSRPPNVPEAELKALPSCPGVYIFWDALNRPLYVGKSVNIRDRVLSHFYADLVDSKERRMKENVHHVEARTTAGEMEALLMESRLIKELQPLYNVRLRQTQGMCVAVFTSEEGGYTRVELERKHHLSSSDLSSLAAVFRTKREGEKALSELAEKHLLCKKMLGLEKGRGPCFGSHVELCAGACCGKEDRASHNARVEKAFAPLRFTQWPSQAPLAYTEYNPITEQTALHVFSQWCHVGSFQGEDGLQLSLNVPSEQEHAFDIDTYHILRRFLRENKAAFRSISAW